MDTLSLPYAPMLLRVEILLLALLVVMIIQTVILAKILRAGRRAMRAQEELLELWKSRLPSSQPNQTRRSA